MSAVGLAELLTAEQQTGTACVMCGRPLAGRNSSPLELPLSGAIVRVCVGPCEPVPTDD